MIMFEIKTNQFENWTFFINWILFDFKSKFCFALIPTTLEVNSIFISLGAIEKGFDAELFNKQLFD